MLYIEVFIVRKFCQKIAAVRWFNRLGLLSSMLSISTNGIGMRMLSIHATDTTVAQTARLIVWAQSSTLCCISVCSHQCFLWYCQQYSNILLGSLNIALLRPGFEDGVYPLWEYHS